MKKIYHRRLNWIILSAAVCAVLLAAVTWTNAKSNESGLKKTASASDTSQTGAGENDSQWSKAFLSVSNMSCGGCVTNIAASLSPLPGIGAINVDVAGGTAEIFFDPDKLQDPQQIAKTITEAGYPAKVERIVAANKVRARAREMAQRAITHIASVGTLEIPRTDFDMELSHARARYQALYGADVFSGDRGKKVLNQIKAQISSRLISEGIKVQEVERAGYTIADEKVTLALDAYLNKRKLSMDAFKSSLIASGYTFDYFKQKFSQRQRVQSYISEVVLNDSLDQDDRQARYANWLSNATALAKVVFYDADLEALVKANNSSGCGGSSCSLGDKKTS